ncbi:GNAT family N-acetyltransferase [Kutzneria sp. NPDC052558]|uniref:GNAT family N-acetyltransferase n=1 Tax=Kutzneria sp. NPDC052558 TaxID=3364121 RepID=UPI0037CAC63A
MLPEGYRTGRPSLADVTEILELVHASDIAAIGYPDYTADDVTAALTGPGFDPAADSWLVRDGDGRLVGWGHLTPEDWFCEAYARPGEGPSVQATLIDLLVGRVAERAPGDVTAEAGALPAEEQYIGVLADAGFVFYRQHARMSRPLTGDEQPPAGTAVRAMKAEELPACVEILRAAFGDSHDYAATASLALAECLVAVTEDGELAGALLSTDHAEDTGEGWVKWLGVHPDHRRRGLAAALLSTAIAANARLGRKAVGLGVNTSSPTKAFTLYERLGFAVSYRANIYRRPVTGTMGA